MPWHPPAPPYCRMVQGDNVVTSSLAFCRPPRHLQNPPLAHPPFQPCRMVQGDSVVTSSLAMQNPRWLAPELLSSASGATFATVSGRALA